LRVNPPSPFLRGTFVRIYTPANIHRSGDVPSALRPREGRFQDNSERRGASEMRERVTEFRESPERRRVEWHCRYRGTGPSRRPSQGACRSPCLPCRWIFDSRWRLARGSHETLGNVITSDTLSAPSCRIPRPAGAKAHRVSRAYVLRHDRGST